MTSYDNFLDVKTHYGVEHGFDPLWMPSMLFDFQQAITEWAIRKGRSAIFADCGLGKTFMQLTWAENVAQKTGKRVLILTPLAVAFQTVREGEKLGVEVIHRREGIKAGDRIIVTNYERLHYFSPDDFGGVVCDESSILKNYDGVMRQEITDFMRKRPYRLLCTATAAPNDYIELGTSSEALGELGSADMLNKFFKRDKKFVKIGNAGGQGYIMRPHGERDFWRWVVSWARAVRKPSDMNFEDDGFQLPDLEVRQHIVKASKPRDGMLFDIPAIGLEEQRADLRNTINERCEMAAELINAHARPAVAWCNLNDEGALLEKKINGAVEISGSDPEERKEQVFTDFIRGNIRVLVTKPTIGGFGLNLQHCAHETFFPSHSYEQYYQAVRRCWRFGQKNTVTVDMITTDGQDNVLKNLQAKAEKASAMFDYLVSLMRNELIMEKRKKFTQAVVTPEWL
jgi:superfamily II DNA or RNA helicase